MQKTWTTEARPKHWRFVALWLVVKIHDPLLFWKPWSETPPLAVYLSAPLPWHKLQSGPNSKDEMCSAGREAIRTKPNMPATKVIKPQTVATSRKSVRESNPVRVRQAAAQLRAPAVRNGRASSCPRCPQHTATQPGCKRKARSSSTTAAAPATRPGRPREASGTGHQREPRATSAHRWDHGCVGETGVCGGEGGREALLRGPTKNLRSGSTLWPW